MLSPCARARGSFSVRWFVLLKAEVTAQAQCELCEVSQPACASILSGESREGQSASQ